jgi:hypothetical protein
MISQIIKNIKADKTELRRFGIIQACVLVVLGGLLLFKGRQGYSYLFAASGIVFGLAIVWPKGLWPIHKIVMLTAKMIGWCLTRIVLIVLFYAVVFPVGFIARLCGKNFLDLKFDRQKESYWIAKKNQPKQKEDYLRQF